MGVGVGVGGTVVAVSTVVTGVEDLVRSTVVVVVVSLVEVAETEAVDTFVNETLITGAPRLTKFLVMDFISEVETESNPPTLATDPVSSSTMSEIMITEP